MDRSTTKINEDKKIRFFKTHNVFGKINDHAFTNKENSIGCIYIVRDPRNVITSISNHYELSYEESLSWMTNHKKYIFDNREGQDFEIFNLLAHGPIITSHGKFREICQLKLFVMKIY